MSVSAPSASRLETRRPETQRFKTGRFGSWWVCVLMVVCLGLAPAAPLSAGPSGELGGMELEPTVRHQFWRLQQAWQGWASAFAGDEREKADTQIQEILGISHHLGMARLPDLSNAAAAMAVKYARDDDFERAYWALEAAEQLDAGRPETAFAQSSVQRLKGDYIGAVTNTLRGYIAVLQMPLQRKLWFNNITMWMIYTLLLSGCVFVALLMVVNGRNLFYELSRLYSPPLQTLQANVVTVLILLWPILLPSGLAWLALYWSVLLWAYCTTNQKATLVTLWLILGLAPLTMSYQQQESQVALIPASRLVDNLAAGRLYGAMFSDLEVLRTMVPDSDIVTELVADLHRRLGQWDYARAIYTELSQDPDRSSRHAAASFCNIGVYHHRAGDYETALNYFKRATDANPNLPEAFYNLSQAYGQTYDFNNQHDAMARAKELAGDRVDQWDDAAVTAEESAVGVDGGLQRVDELREHLAGLWRRGDQSQGFGALWRRYRALSVAAAAIALAFVLSRLRKQTGAVSDRLPPSPVTLGDNPWVRALVPGLASVQRGSGITSYLGIVMPMGLILLWVVRGVGYRAPLATDPGHWLALGFATFSLLLFFGLRIFLERS